MSETATPPSSGEEARRSLRWIVNERLSRMETNQVALLNKLNRLEELLQEVPGETEEEQELRLSEANNLEQQLSSQLSQPISQSPMPTQNGGRTNAPLELAVPATPAPQRIEEELDQLHEHQQQQIAAETKKRGGLRNWI